MSEHRTIWEDAQLAGVECDGVDVGMIGSHDKQPEPFICDRCGVQLRLIWDVRLEEVPDTASRTEGEGS